MKNAGEVQERSAGADRVDRHALDIIPENADPGRATMRGAGYALSAALDPRRSWRVAIAEVAYLAGFSDQGHLATAMKKHKGKKPWLGR
ncbi:hypothetical protein X744_11765 [Mesorhizobium sp. LNJC372A00]|nr:hypothetical protein X745_17325 [Mesorhizobium sp. LNJC374B00]ESY59899.1 hypothetical protein X744_11765 [Mesorhizobium sp. LNJC372A00]